MVAMSFWFPTAAVEIARISALRLPTNPLFCRKGSSAGEMFSHPMRWTGTKITRWTSSLARDPTPPTAFTFSPARALAVPHWSLTTARYSLMAWDSNNSHRASWITMVTEITTCLSPSVEAALPFTWEKAAPSSQANPFLSTRSSLLMGPRKPCLQALPLQNQAHRWIQWTLSKPPTS